VAGTPHLPSAALLNPLGRVPGEIELNIHRMAHQMCLADVKRELLTGIKCTCKITMGDHEMIDKHLGASVEDGHD
jgi:hypothetical protein